MIDLMIENSEAQLLLKSELILNDGGSVFLWTPITDLDDVGFEGFLMNSGAPGEGYSAGDPN